MNKQEILLSIKSIRSKIESNTANVDDYNSYIDIVDKYGKFSSKEIMYQLRKYGYNTLEEFIEGRSNMKTKSGCNPVVGHFLNFSSSFLQKNWTAEKI